MSGLSLWSPHQHLRRAAAAYLNDGAGEDDDVGDLPSLSKHDQNHHRHNRRVGGGATSSSRAPALPQWPSLPACSSPPPDLLLCCSGSSSSTTSSSANTTTPDFEKDYTSPPARSSSSFATSTGAGTSVHPRRSGAGGGSRPSSRPSSRQSSTSTNPFDCDNEYDSHSPTTSSHSDPELHGNLRLASHYQYSSNGEMNEQVEAIVLPTGVSGRSSTTSSSSYPSLLDDELDDEAHDILATTPPKGRGNITTTTKPPLPTCLPHPRSCSPPPLPPALEENSGWTTPPRPRRATTTTTSATTTATESGTDTDSATATDTPPDSPLSPKLLVQEDLQHLLAGKSAVQAFNFLQAMVIDLLNELEEIQSYHRDQMEDQMIFHAQQTRDYAQIATAIQQALQQRIDATSTKETKEEEGGTEVSQILLQRLQNDCEALQTQVSLLPPPRPTEDDDTHSSPRRSSAAGFFLRRTPSKKKKPQDPGPSALQGFQCVVQQLTSHMEHLQQRNDQLSEQIKAQQEAIDDLKALCDAKTFKIEALELQFSTLNQSRSHLAQKLVDRTHQMLTLRRTNTNTNNGSGSVSEDSVNDSPSGKSEVVRVAASSSSPLNNASPTSSRDFLSQAAVGMSPASQ